MMASAAIAHVPQLLLPPQIHVIVVGGGLAGLSATIEAYRAGTHVVLVDKEPKVGGNSAKASSGINAVNTPAQSLKFKKTTDSIDLFLKDTDRSGAGKSDPVLIQTLTSKSTEAHSWLESFGISLDNISQCGGHSFPRTHRESPRSDGKPVSVGFDIIKTLKAYIDNELVNKSNPHFGSITILNKCRVAQLIIENDRVKGVTGEINGEELTMRSAAVILTTGGFSANREMLKQYAPQLSHFPTTNGPWATGDGIQLLQDHGVEFVHMDQVQLHPSGFIDPNNPDSHEKILAPEALRGHGGILLSVGNAHRFTNELGPRDQVVDHILTRSPVSDGSQKSDLYPHACAFLVMNQAAVDLFEPNVVKFYTARGLFKVIDGGVEGLVHLFHHGFAGCAAPDASVESLTHTFDNYSLAAAGNLPDPFGKHVFPITFSAQDKFYVAAVTPVIHYTMGGLKINAVSEVLRTGTDPLTLGPTGVAFPGLFAAGEVSGGVHGKNRLAGNSLLECVVFGRIAGQRAAAFVTNESMPALKLDLYTSLRLRSAVQLTQYTKLFQFDLPSSAQTVGLKLGEYVSVRAVINGKEFVRYYSPISPLEEPGHLDILVKVDEVGVMSHYINELRPGIDSLEFQGPFGAKFPDLGIHANTNAYGMSKPIQDNTIKRIGLICGGTGIAPMIQIIRSMVLNCRSDVNVYLLYGAVTEVELVYKDLLQQLARKHTNIELCFIVENPSELWPQNLKEYGVGLLTEHTLQAHLPKPGNDLKVIVCGPFKMCTEVKKSLISLGYTKEMWYSFM